MRDLIRRRWKVIFGILVSLFFVWLSLRGLHLGELGQYLRQANYGWILPGIVVYFGAVGLVMLLFVFFALPFVGAEHIPPVYRVTVIVASIAFFAALAFFLWMVFDERRASAVYRFFADRLIPARLRGPLDGFYARFLEGLHFLRSGRDVLMVFVTSIVIWLLETVKYWFVMHAFAFTIIGLMLMNGVVNLTTTLPSAPGYIGTFEIGARVLEALGVDYGLAFGYTIVLHAALWFPITLLGGYYMWREGVKWRDFDRKNSEEFQAP